MRSLSRPRLIGLHDMDWPDYLRDHAAKYRQLAEQTDDPVIKNEMLARLRLRPTRRVVVVAPIAGS
jgi:hypothetical protein